MKVKKNIAIAATALTVVGASLGGVALASSGDSGPTGAGVSQSAENSATDADNIQEGDQTGSEEPDTEAESGSETEGAESDGPGGWEDPPGNVDHQFEGEE